jgi:hypothetical protein
MPKEEAMAQLSRPFQIVLVVFALFAAVWFVALRGHTNSTSSSSTAPSASAPVATPSAPAKAAKAAAPGGIHHGSAPGVEGLTRAIARAHGAVAASQRNVNRQEAIARHLEGKPNKAPVTTASKPTAVASAPVTHKAASPTATKPATASLAPERAVEAELHQGNVAVVLFWNPSGADDKLVHRELQQLAASPAAKRHGRGIAVHYAAASQIASFGSITRGVQVYGTPTLLVVDQQGKTSTLTGFTDVFAIEQAIDELRSS